MKLVTFVGARPQFVKAAVVSRAIASLPGAPIEELLIHTGQHFSANMSDVFFDELGIPEPRYNLGIASLSHGAMTGRMIEKIEKVLIDETPDSVLIYGDTNSTLAAALAAVKLHIPIVHVEAGLRSFNMRMPEEVNRILSDRISSLLLCPTQLAVENLSKEGISEGVHWVGDVMFDAARIYGAELVEKCPPNTLVGQLNNYVLCTLHRAENTDHPRRLHEIFRALVDIAEETEVVLPVHPRTRKVLETLSRDFLGKLNVIEPVSFGDMLVLERGARAIFTDSGGVQKEAYFQGVPCITLRDETEWLETVELGWNRIVGAEYGAIMDAWHNLDSYAKSRDQMPYGDGFASEAIAKLLLKSI